MIDDTFESIPELAILADISAKAWIHRLATTVNEAREESIKVQMEMKLYIIELWLKA